jgi:hypothetical protein
LRQAANHQADCITREGEIMSIGASGAGNRRR